MLWQWQQARQNAQAVLRQRYTADMHLAQLAQASNNREFAFKLLDTYRPGGKPEARNPKSETDLRGWEWRYLWELCQGDEASTLHQYARNIAALAVSRDGRWLAVATRGEVGLWDLASRQRLTGFRPGARPALAFSPVDELLAMGTRDTQGRPGVDLWDPSAGKVVKTLHHEAEVRSPAFSPDGSQLPEEARSDMVSAAIAVAYTGDHASPRASRIPWSRSRPPIRERQNR